MSGNGGDPERGRIVLALEQLVGHGAAIARLVARGKQSYDADEMLRYAAEDLLLRAGESVRRIDAVDPGFVDAHADVELRKLKDARNVVAHGYDIVDSEIIWVILSIHVPIVVKRVRVLIEEMRPSGPAS